MSLSPKRKVIVISAIMLAPAAICWGIGWSLADNAAKEFASARETTAVVAAVAEDRVRFNGRNSEEITEVQLTFTPEGAATPVTASVAVWSASGLTVGGSVGVRYLPSTPTTVRLQGSFWNRPSGEVFLTLFGAFWLGLDLLLTAALWVVVGRLGRGRTA